MKESKITIRQLRLHVSSTTFRNSYESLVLGKEESLSNISRIHLLKIAVIFLNLGDDNLKRFGYHIILRYSLLFKYYKPLYDVSLNKGFIPVSKFIEDKFIPARYNDNFFHSYFSSYQENFFEKEIYLSYGQKKLFNYSKSNNSNNFVLVAPTSYGKSEIIVDKVGANLSKKICIIVPSKALLAQTKRRLLGSEYAADIGRIITHPEMYRGNEISFVAVLTQERLLRLLQKNNELIIDLALVDEAHNLLKNDGRGILLAQVIMILKKRNPGITLNFFSPFISEGKNLKIPYMDYSLEDQRTSENIKVEKFFVCNLKDDKKLKLYDQFLNEFIDYRDEKFNNEIALIHSKKAKKNIIYLNRPKHVEDFAKKIAVSNSNSNIDINEVVTTIADFLHPEYTLLKCLKSGVAYHHGGMPELIRLYVENEFSTNDALQYIVTNSTLLEGVNIPAEKIFLLTTKIGRRLFNKSQFKNLIGRVCRFSEIFNRETGNLNMLEPEVYLLKSGYEDKDANHETFIVRNAKSDVTFKDDVENLLLKDPKSELTILETQNVKDIIEYLENIEPNTVQYEGIDYAQTEIGRLCYKNNVEDFPIKDFEMLLDSNLKSLKVNVPISNSDDVIDAIYHIFINGIDNSDKSISRLENERARHFYSMFLTWRSSSSSYKEMIAKFMSYWNGIENKLIYFGSTWGENKRNDTDHIPLYIDLNEKSQPERVNLAILKIKDEQDYVEFKILKYIDILSELGLLSKNFYERIKYGSSDPLVISLLKNGFSIELAKCKQKERIQSFWKERVQSFRKQWYRVFGNNEYRICDLKVGNKLRIKKSFSVLHSVTFSA